MRGHPVKLAKHLKQILIFLTLPVVAIVSLGAAAAEPPAAPVMEAYTCSYNAGKVMKDLLAARDYCVKQAEKAGIKLA